MRRLPFLLPLATCLNWACAEDPAPGADGIAGGDRGGPPSSEGGPTADQIRRVDQGGAGPLARFVSPAPGATVKNPVLFTIAAAGVSEVQILADKTYPLSPPWDPALRKTLLYRFANAGQRSLHLSGRLGGQELTGDDLSITVEPDSCEDRFFVSKFAASNADPGGELDLASIREEALAAVKQAVADLQACGAKVTLGGMLSLLYFEGAFRAAAYNTRCSENSYHPSSSGCDVYPEALYSYQYGLGAIHTSNFHPCKDIGYTGKMRARFLSLAAAAGFSTAGSLVTSTISSRVKQFCPGATANAVDYYILAAHDTFKVPKNSAGNHLAGYATFPFYRAAVSVGLTLGELVSACASITDDRKAIAIYGGGDKSYRTAAKQDTILALYKSFAAANCQ